MKAKRTENERASDKNLCESCARTGFVRNQDAKAARVSFSLLCAFRCAGAGLLEVVKSQRNMKIHIVVALVVIVAGFLFFLDSFSWGILILCIAAVFATECINTALESLVDLVSPNYHDLARRTKDCAAAAVLISALAAVVVALVIFIPRIAILL